MNKHKIMLIAYLLVVGSFLLEWGCTVMDGVTHVKIVNEKGSELQRVLIVPLYEMSFVISCGLEKGFHSRQQFVVTKPFLINSGDDLMKKKISTQGVNLMPLTFVGKSNAVDNWIFMKEGFTPRVVHRSDLSGALPIVLTRANSDKIAVVINLLLAERPNQSALKKQFDSESIKDDIKVLFDEKDVALLKNILKEKA